LTGLSFGSHFRRRRTAGRGRIRDDAEKLGDARECDPAPTRRIQCRLDRPAGTGVLRSGRSMRRDEQVGVDRDHRCRRSHSCIIARSDTSTPGGSPPSTVTQRIVRALPSVRLAVRPSSARKPRSIRTRSGCRSSAARCLAAMKRSSGRSTVVFIWENSFPSLLPVKWRRSFKNLPDRVSLGRQPAHRRPRGAHGIALRTAPSLSRQRWPAASPITTPSHP
jgi:hypothetical protein